MYPVSCVQPGVCNRCANCVHTLNTRGQRSRSEGKGAHAQEGTTQVCVTSEDCVRLARAIGERETRLVRRTLMRGGRRNMAWRPLWTMEDSG